MTTTFLGSVTRLGVLLDEDVMVYVDQPNSAAQIPVGTAADVTLTERDVMISDRTRAGTPQVDAAERAVRLGGLTLADCSPWTHQLDRRS